MTADELAGEVGAAAAQELKDALGRIKHCLNQLTDEQVWWRPAASMNSIGNLVLHLCGNVRQWLVSGLGGAADVRNRPVEFSERGPIPKQELLRRLEKVVSEAEEVLKKRSATDLVQPRRIQAHNVTGLGAIFSSVPHFRGHTQEIIHMTRSVLGETYRFAWKPASTEEGA